MHTATSLGEYKNVVRQEEEEEAKQAAGTGKDLCHPSGYNNETARAVSLMITVSLLP